MATVTAPEQHGLYAGIPFSQKGPTGVGHQYSLATEDDISPMVSPLFPQRQSPILSSSGPIPNPPFVFPARPATSSAPLSFSKATGRRPNSAYELQGGAAGFGCENQKGAGRSLPAPLPSFSFNPSGQSVVESGMASPPQSPNSPGSGRSIPSRPGGHRRGGSEFIGGDGKTGAGMGLMSTSPTKGDGVLPPPNALSLGPPTGRRGHAHRRSAAVSCHDLSMILKPPSLNTPLGGSAPTSPSDNNCLDMSFPCLDMTTQKIGTPQSSSQESGGVSSPPDTPPTRANRNRVGFSDTIEFIPRPLSLVSSDASSTATMRPGHSVSNSLSSVMSAGASSPPSKDQRGPSNLVKGSETRPSTAGPILGSAPNSLLLDNADFTRKRRNSNPPTPTEPAKPIEPPSTPKILPRKYFFFGHDTSSTGEASPTKSRPVSSGSLDKPRCVVNPSISSSPEQFSDVPIASVEHERATTRRPSLTRKPSKKQKKVRSWAGSILSRKPRQRSQKQKALSRKSPTPPLRSFEVPIEPSPSLELSSTTIPTFDEATKTPPAPPLQTDFASWKPRQVQPQDEDSMSPVIDLDAALGPFNTPLGYDADWEASQRGSGPTKRRMHSAMGVGGFVGPFHRRAESAPEMENPRFGLHHIGSRSTMEDVFEEDEEEDNWEEVKSISHKGSKNTVNDEEANGLGVDIKVESESVKTETVMDWTTEQDATVHRGLKRKGSGLSEGDRRQTNSGSKSKVSINSQMDGLEPDDKSTTDMGDDLIVSRPESRAKSSDSSKTPPLRPHTAKDLTPAEAQSSTLQPPFLPPTSPQSTAHSPSPFPSPRSPFSYDTQRISTAPSSFTDEQNFQSLLLGEPGPELRVSVDDVPSLTSSNSTMTRESTFSPGFGNPQFRDGQRSASLSGPSTTRKRSSIASLSRLLNSSHGERSKLSIEERAPSSPERKEKLGKGRRLSRMMQFWKAKDTSAS
jgi:hypothetical protein